MSIAAQALRHRTLVLLVVASLVAGGLLSANGLASGIYPEVDFPRIGVVVTQGDAPPAVFQTNVARPVEQALITVLGVERVRSRTIRGGVEISLLFAPDADMWRALQLVQSSLSDVRSTLPPDVVVHAERLTPVSFPVLTFNVSGPLDSRALNEVAELELRPALARVHGVGAVTVLGGDVREVEVIVSPDRAAAAHLALDDIASRVRRSIPLAAVGRLEQDRSLVTVLASAEATSVEDIAGIPLGVDALGQPIPLGSVAEVREGRADRFFRTTGPSGDCVSIGVARLEGASTPEVVAAVKAAVEALSPSLPRGVRVEPVYDQGRLVGDAMASVRDAILLGIGLCLLVLGAFLRDARAGFVAAVAVPVTLVITFLAMRLLGQTLNLMSLGGMAVSIGLVVDDAIVVVEAIARRLEAGEDPETAAREGTRELTAAVVGTTITTVIVFLPLVFLPGIVGSFFGALALTLASAVVISLAVALCLVPILAARIMRARPVHRSEGALERGVGRLVAWSADRRGLGLALCLAACGFSYVAVDHVPSGFMPACDEGAFVLDYETPAGTSLTETDALARRVESILRETPEVETFSRRTGAQVGPAAVTLLNTGDFVVRLRSRRTRHAEAIMDDLRGRIEAEIPGMRVEFIQILQDMLNDLAGAPHPIEIKIFGEDETVLERLADEVTRRIERVPGLVDLSNGLERPSPMRTVSIDRTAAARLGLTAEDVATRVASALVGTTAGTLRRFDRTIDIRVRYPYSVRNDAVRLGSLPIAFTAEGPIGLSGVARLEDQASPTVLYHEGLEPVVIVHADHSGRDLGSVVRDIERALHGLRLPPGYRFELGGQYAEQVATTRRLATVAAAGLLLVLIVLVAQFRRFSSALAVLLTAPLSLVGALATLWITDVPLDASSLMGCVLLVGLVVKNGILLLEVAEEHADHGVPYGEALALAGRRRIRPIAMTTLATLFGLLPLALAIGAGSELQRPLAVAVLGGLSVSAILSLAALPSLASAFETLARRERGPGTPSAQRNR